MPIKNSAPELEVSVPKVSRRQKRAEALRKRALSPVRIILMVLMLPVTTLAIAVGIYLRTSEFRQEEALLHLIALAGCGAIETIVPGPFVKGGPGYHPHNDPNGDGVACDTRTHTPVQDTVPQTVEPSRSRTLGNAKFVRP